MALRPSVLDQKYAFEYDVGQWTYGKISILRLHTDATTRRTCKTVPKSLVKSGSSVMAQLLKLRELQHHHICSITDVMEDQVNYYVISEFMQGGEVSDWVERLQDGYAIQEQTCAAYVRQAILAMMHSHSVQVFHGALLPSSLCLSSKMPDAFIKVTDFGLSGLLDPEGSVVKRNQSPYTAPEVLSGEYGFPDSTSDMYSIGAIAHALLVGRAPTPNGSQGFFARMRGGDDAWSERSAMSHDFVKQLLLPWDERPTPARALQHPFLKGTVQSISGVLADKTAEAEVQQKTLCYMLAVLMLPNALPYRDFEKLRSTFQDQDSDNDGLVPRNIAQRILRGRCALKEAVEAAIKIVDVGGSDAYDLCSTACADLIARDFFASGPTGQPLVGPFKASDLAPRMLKRFFESLGSKQSSVTLPSLRARLRTATARDVELYAEVSYEDLFSLFVALDPIDAQSLSAVLADSGGQGTPLGSGSFGGARVTEVESFGGGLLGGGLFDFLGQCGMGMKRQGSPHSVITQ